MEKDRYNQLIALTKNLRRIVAFEKYMIGFKRGWSGISEDFYTTVMAAIKTEAETITRKIKDL
jgi:hypothetical protein